jgi:hypothetical protein
MNKPIQLFAFVGLLFCLAGCYRDEPVYTSDLDLVITNYQKDFNFAAKGTFSLPDSVVLISSENFDGSNDYAKPAYANTILAKIRSNMIQNHWVEVDKSANPDVIILPSVSQTTNIFYYYNYGYWDWYYPGSYYPGGWGWYYPGYYFPPTASSYKSGSVFIQMTDPSGSAGSDQLPVVWTCIINGLLEGSTSGIQARIGSTIDQAFTQSPYLKK